MSPFKKLPKTLITPIGNKLAPFFNASFAPESTITFPKGFTVPAIQFLILFVPLFFEIKTVP